MKMIQWIFMVSLVLQFVSGNDQIRCIRREREALLQFKASVVDDGHMLSSWNTNDCCEWKGIGCSNLTGHIVMLDLHGNYLGLRYDDKEFFLSGEIHKSLMELQQLQYFNLSWNHFQGSHIPHFFASLTHLRSLDLSNSYFGGKISTQFGSLSHLKYLNLAQNYLEGSIPYQLGNLSNLHHLDLGFNFLEGKLPSQLGNLSNLQYLDLRINSLKGNIPSQLGKLSNLQTLYLGGRRYESDSTLKIDDGNHVKGQWLSNLTSLTHLYFWSMSNLNSSYSWMQMIVKLPQLRELSLYDCSLSDHFILSLRPFKFNFSTSLSILDLSWNTFTSSMILEWASNITSNLVELDLSGNYLGSSISNYFAPKMVKLPKLRKLTLHYCILSDNFLHSMTPSKFNFSTSLSTLDLSRNTFTSSNIFHWISNISSNLIELDLSGNLLVGSKTLNHFVIVMNSLQRLDLSFNRLNGKILNSILNICTLSSLKMEENNISEDLPSIIHTLSSGCIQNSLQELVLSNNQIIGSLIDISMFSSLKFLDLSKNCVSGKIPEDCKLPPQLVSLSIQSNTLEGGIPKSFGNSCALRSLDMYNNSLSEGLPMIIHHLSGCARYSLEELDLSINQINGTLPNLSIFSSLKGLHLGFNRINGKIPIDIQFPPQLERLDMSSNSLKGVITEYHFADLSKLILLDLSNNSLDLEFTKNWVPSFQLRYLSMRSCKFGPAFPKWLRTQNNIEVLDISNCGISDIIPEWFWTKLVLQLQDGMIDISYNNITGTISNLPLKNSYPSLNLASNQFEGPIPQFLRGFMMLDLSKNKFSNFQSFLCAKGKVETLGQLDLSHNQLSGQIPNCWGHFKSLAYLDLSYNNFSGKIPTSIGSLLELQTLILRNNNLTNEIPFSLSNCSKLVMLDLGQNRLTGPIPFWIGSRLQELQMLSLQKNNFFGSLPLQLCYLQSIQLLDLSFNNLSGQIPKCLNNFTSMTQKDSLKYYARHRFFINSTKLPMENTYELNALLMWKGVEEIFQDSQGVCHLYRFLSLPQSEVLLKTMIHRKNIRFANMDEPLGSREGEGIG
ncbi:hypothetical protein VNO77_33668 [Canavalia gladiata]|uniref:Leucine-rich repeat-containing N-terminal plant-type domain-containing protein n=1 Tax=Canavalia gladiata TaxID=3824 RepID=A0AAN9KE86_CANGL